MPAKKKETYSQAIERLEKIVRQIDSNELEIDELSEKILLPLSVRSNVLTTLRMASRM